MTTRRLVPAALLLALAFSARAADPVAIGPSTLPANAALEPNAALRYWFAFEFAPHSEADLALLEGWQTAPLDDSAKNLCQSARRSLDFLKQGAPFAEANWGLDYTQGPNLLLPHLGKARNLARIACFDARLHFSEHQAPAAVDQLGDTLALARHLSQDQILISLLVRYRIEAMALQTLAAHLPELDPATRGHLQDRLDHLPRSTVMADCLAGEHHWFVEWTIARIRSGAKTDWITLYGGESDASRALRSDPQACLPQLEALAPLMAEGRKILASHLSPEEFTRQSDALRQRASDNPFAKSLFDSYSKAYETETAAVTQMALLRAALVVLQQGPDALKSIHDPILHQPIEFHSTPHGFTLQSSVTKENQPVTLTIGPEK